MGANLDRGLDRGWQHWATHRRVEQATVPGPWPYLEGPGQGRRPCLGTLTFEKPSGRVGDRAWGLTFEKPSGRVGDRAWGLLTFEKILEGLGDCSDGSRRPWRLPVVPYGLGIGTTVVRKVRCAVDAFDAADLRYHVRLSV